MAHTFVDFFAGIGLFRMGMERAGWTPLLSIDHDPRKHRMHCGEFGESVPYLVGDVHDLRAADVPTATLAHASFPCTDLSLAGSREGLSGPGSSAFWAFVRVLEDLGDRRPVVVTLENVAGFVTSNGGRDFHAALAALNRLGYAVDAFVIDATHFVPQSRSRVFVLGVADGGLPDQAFQTERALHNLQRPPTLRAFIGANPDLRWRLNDLPPMPVRTVSLCDLVDEEAEWWPDERTHYLVSQMSDRHAHALAACVEQDTWTYGTAFRRTRVRDGLKQSTAELRLDGVAGCLRTPKGGSAKQILVRVGRGRADARLLSGRECARLMGAEGYTFDPSLSRDDLLFGFGDAVCVPAVTWLAQTVLEAVLEAAPCPAVFEPSLCDE